MKKEERSFFNLPAQRTPKTVDRASADSISSIAIEKKTPIIANTSPKTIKVKRKTKKS
jgi:hypothetical protein